MQAMYLTIWSNGKFEATSTEPYLHNSLKDAFDGGLEQCGDHDGQFSIVFFDTAKGTSEDLTDMAHEEFSDAAEWPREVVLDDGKIIFGEVKDDDIPPSERAYERNLNRADYERELAGV